jgi:hypothetical protein
VARAWTDGRCARLVGGRGSRDPHGARRRRGGPEQWPKAAARVEALVKRSAASRPVFPGLLTVADSLRRSFTRRRPLCARGRQLGGSRRSGVSGGLGAAQRAEMWRRFAKGRSELGFDDSPQAVVDKEGRCTWAARSDCGRGGPAATA